MLPASRAFRASLVAIAAAVAALVAHVTIDVAGDYLLARDAYDGIEHQSRAVFVVAIAALALVAGSRLLFDLLDRRCSSTASLLRLVARDLGSPGAFVLQTIALAFVTLAGMELLDCAAAGTPVDDLADLFGGSLALGLTATFASGALAGWLLHALVRALARREPELADLVYRIVFATPQAAAEFRGVTRERDARTAIERALMLSRRGTKRGPPLLAPG
jgi:hypothetical protein